MNAHTDARFDSCRFYAAPHRLHRIILPALAILALAGTLHAQTPDDTDYKVNTGLETFGRVYREVAEGYVDDVDPEQIINVGIQAMLERLDPYTVFNANKITDETETLTTGSYTGIGISVRVTDSGLVIADLADGYSAEQAGVRIGDRILSVDTADLRTASLTTLRRYIRGKANTSMKLTVAREGSAKPFTFDLKRQSVAMHSSEFSGFLDTINGIGYIKLSRFGATAGDEVRTAYLGMQKERPLHGLILDLRGNPGGLLESAVDVSSKFIPSGSVVVSTRSRDTTQERTYRSSEEPIARNIPLVVLIDNSSASASEIVAGVIQDLDAGIVMGTPSFGKGLVQSVRQLPNDATLKLTTARYYTPSGRSIQKIDYSRNRFNADNHNPVSVAQGKDYHTRAGRVVTDHSGIVPDTVVYGADTSAITVQLQRAGVFFRFANRYTATLTSLAPGFTVDDILIRRFEEFSESATAALPAASNMLSRARDLRETAQRLHYSPAVLQSLDKLQSEITDEFRLRMKKEREDIRRELTREITGRFTTQKTRFQSRLASDRQVSAAIGLLISGKTSYTRMLTATDKLKEEQ